MNPTRDEHERRRLAAADAAAWISRLESHDLSAEERAALVDWLRESPVHVAELLRADRVGMALRHFRNWQGAEGTAFAAERNVVMLRAPREDARYRHTPARRVRFAAAAAVLLGLVLLPQWSPRNPEFRDLHTDSSERLEFTLEDGSIVRLSPSTDLRVHMHEKRRSLILERGEAQFRVAKDPARPFVVQTAGARIEAVGTVFSVAQDASEVVVTVTEGRVHVLPATSVPEAALPRMPLALDANQRVKLSAAGTVGEVRRIEPSLDARRDGGMLQLVFEETTVGEVIAMFNRRNGVQIRIADPALGGRRVSGFFDPDDPGSFVDFLTVVAGAQSEQSAAGEIIVTGPAAPSR